MIRVYWEQDREVFRPHSQSLAKCKRLQSIGPYTVNEDSVSEEEFGHYFARLKELYDNLPEAVAMRWSNIRAFRGWCLIHEGYCHEFNQPFANIREAAMASIPLVKMSLREGHPYILTRVVETVLFWWVPESQARNGGMSIKRWRESKQKVLELAEFLVNGGELAA